MKKPIISLMLLSIMILTSCTPKSLPTEEAIMTPSDETGIPPEATQPETPGFIKSSLARERFPEVNDAQLAALADANTAFAMDFYREIAKQEGNLIYSPFSLSLALSMTLAGAEGETEAGMLDALRLTLPEDRIYPAYNAVLLALAASQNSVERETGDAFQLHLANSLWGQAGYDFKSAFLDRLAQHFGAGMYQVDFRQNPDRAREAINDWVEEATEDKIQDLIPEGAVHPLTRLVLANAIYFNGSWQYPFEAGATTETPFRLLDDTTTQVDMMQLSGKLLPYAAGEGYQAVQLPYLSSDFGMTVLVPAEGTFDTFEESLTSDALQTIMASLQSTPVTLHLPRFDFETDTDAKEPLKALGMEAAFDEQLADFTGISEEDDLLITDVLQKATITVDEDGTEAAAATAVIVGLKSALPEEPVTLVVDRPFLFLIRHQPTGAILFMGRVVAP